MEEDEAVGGGGDEVDEFMSRLWGIELFEGVVTGRREAMFSPIPAALN